MPESAKDDDLVGSVVAWWARHAPELPAQTIEFTKRVARMHALTDRVTVAVLTGFSLSRAEYDVLGTLLTADRPGLRPSELSSRLLLTTGGLSNVLRSLERRGLAALTSDSADRRGRRVALTPEGADVAGRVVREVVAAQHALLSTACEADVRVGTAALAAVLAPLESRAAGR
ncbi:DNA-binding transcriptional regulator, MarR family [Lentzea xinjiangensis]|uniref:DNA-binding transcriptional regulator, MarR family n=1 Tax=Lentzea xinjiangensis TaxID=402600 RepID=A0A1H9K3L3_9PSEU|nr:MarR family transcriptional regulator [Lentzea xinjiangensis]SEQ93523.1 DNA-binding transcriptional regulator, MarR family [Lentzea xinjiangensis]